MSQQLINLSPDIKRLRDEGYHIQVRRDVGYLIVHDVPYVTKSRVVQFGSLISSLTLAGDATTTPSDHVAYFIGDTPCDKNGRSLDKVINSFNLLRLADDLTANITLSSKPADGYNNYYEKMTTYINILLGHAKAIDDASDPRTFLPIEEDSESPFKYIDTATSRAGISLISQKVANCKVAIVGLGGTGSYILDFVAKTHVREIHIFDGDIFLQHNAFRSPGAPNLELLGLKLQKVQHFERIYSNMRNRLISHSCYIDQSNIHLLDDIDFVFLCVDGSEGKQEIIENLELKNKSFIDTGIGLYSTGDALAGIVRTTFSTFKNRNLAKQSMSHGGGELNNEYSQNIQIAELNAINAALAVIRWKKQYGIYSDFEQEYASFYTLDGNHLINQV